MGSVLKSRHYLTPIKSHGDMRQPDSRHPRSSVRDAKTRNAVRSLLSWVVVLSFSVGCNLGVQQHNIAGRQAYEMGQFNSAINEFQKSLQLNPRNADAYYNLAASYYAIGKQNRNDQVINDRHVEAHRGLSALLIETGQEKFAFDLMNTWKSRYPNSPEPSIELARLYQEYGDNRRATDQLVDALRTDSNNVRALKALGHIREIQGQTHLALDNYLRVLQLDNSQTDVAQRVATLQTQLAQANATIGGASQTGNVPPRYGSTAPYLPR
jgi:Tfp pilus assembly protein PilF